MKPTPKVLCQCAVFSCNHSKDSMNVKHQIESNTSKVFECIAYRTLYTCSGWVGFLHQQAPKVIFEINPCRPILSSQLCNSLTTNDILDSTLYVLGGWRGVGGGGGLPFNNTASSGPSKKC